jgi:hypothetical protein
MTALAPDVLARMRENPAGVPFRDLLQVCRVFFGEPRQRTGSHVVFRTPWAGDPRVNIQPSGRMAKAYHVRQVLDAIDRLQQETGRGH